MLIVKCIKFLFCRIPIYAWCLVPLVFLWLALPTFFLVLFRKGPENPIMNCVSFQWNPRRTANKKCPFRKKRIICAKYISIKSYWPVSINLFLVFYSIACFSASCLAFVSISFNAAYIPASGVNILLVSQSCSWLPFHRLLSFASQRFHCFAIYLLQF